MKLAVPLGLGAFTASKEIIHSPLPGWFRQGLPTESVLALLRALSQKKINTVCQSARCPNLNRCFNKRELTVMILGDTCTRDCRFCANKKSSYLGLAVDNDEPLRVAEFIQELGLDYVVITSVTRDDLGDGGASHFVKTIQAIRLLNHAVTIETLIPDFKARTESLAILIESRPSVVGHNLETVPKLYRQLKPLSRYEDSLLVLRTIKQINPAMLTKSSLMLGLGETSDDIVGALEDLKEVGCDMVTFGQYLSPSKAHYPVQKFLSLQEFQDYAQLAKEHGFKTVSSGPLVRSSFKAKELFKEAACTM